MPYEEDQLAALDRGEVQAKADDEARHARYVADDAETAAKRANDDVLAQGGIAARASRRLELQQAIKVRDYGTPASQDEMQTLKDQIAALQAMIMAKPASAPTPDTKPAA